MDECKPLRQGLRRREDRPGDRRGLLGARSLVPGGLIYVFECRGGRAPARAAVGASERLPVG